MKEVLLSLGSNIDRRYHLNAALERLRQEFGAVALSPVYESSAVGFEGAAFYNLVAAAHTDLSLTALNQCLKRIEDDCGRDRSQPKYSSRTLDIDVLTYGEHAGFLEGVRLPRDEVFRHAFVLRPLADLRPDQRIPGEQRTWSELWAGFDPGEQRLSPVTL